MIPQLSCRFEQKCEQGVQRLINRFSCRPSSWVHKIARPVVDEERLQQFASSEANQTQAAAARCWPTLIITLLRAPLWSFPSWRANSVFLSSALLFCWCERNGFCQVCHEPHPQPEAGGGGKGLVVWLLQDWRCVHWQDCSKGC